MDCEEIPEREGLLGGGDAFLQRKRKGSFWKLIPILVGTLAFIFVVEWRSKHQLPETQDPFFHSSSNSEKDQPFSKSIQESPNWLKISSKQFSARPLSLETDNTEFESYPEPTFTKVGNRTVATYTLIITKGTLAPDGYSQPAILINGQSPGPEIRVPFNSILIVHVENYWDKPTTIHFHGIHQRRSFIMDGVPDVTQYPIQPNSSYTYEMDLGSQTGTYFYHSHVNLDILWVFGPLIIEDNPTVYSSYPPQYHYDEDRVFILNGVFHDDLDSMVERIVGPVHDYPGALHSITINGRAFSNVTNNITGRALSRKTKYGYDITTVTGGLRYRFRFINAASDFILGCSIYNHTVVVMETDGVYIEPVTSDYISISPGQRYSVIVNMNLTNDNYFITCRYLEFPGPLNGVALINYLNATKPSKNMLDFYNHGPEYFPGDRWIEKFVKPNLQLKQDVYCPVPVTLDKEHVLDIYEDIRGQRHVYLVNGHYFEDPEVPYFQQLQQGINITYEPQVFELVEGESVQFVLQNTRFGSYCFSHPWHIHGHYFHIVGDGPDQYDPITDGARIQQNVNKGTIFPYRDSVTVWANQTVGDHVDGAMCGWAAVRFLANNNGLWLAHCHVTPHLMMGKKFVIWEHSKSDPMLTELLNTSHKVNRCR